MGMAASQVRLLALTDRLHDIELKSQQLLAQKLALGTQKDALYNDYCDALEATNYMVAFNDRANNATMRYVDATYENLCTYMPDRMRQYSLVNTRNNKVYVTQDEKEIYERYSNDKYAYAMAMLGLDDGFGSAGLSGANDQVNPGTVLGLNSTGVGSMSYLNAGSLIDPNKQGELSADEIFTLNSLLGSNVDYVNAKSEYDKALANGDTTKVNDIASSIRTRFANIMPKNITGDGNDVLMTEAEVIAFMNASDTDRQKIQGTIDAIFSEDCKDPQAAYEAFRDKLYELLAEEIFDAMSYIQDPDADPESRERLEDREEFNFYVNRWTAINNAGGCEVIDAQYESGDDAREWLENMVKAGLIVIQECNNKGEWSDTSIATSTNGNYLMEDKDDLGQKKAEAEYEHELDIIDRKETKMDNELAILETERKAITTEMDSLKTVKDDNIERTFGIFG